jgi:hypothetical protein
MGSLLCLPARETCLRSSSLLCFLSSCTDSCTGNGGPSLIEHSATTGRRGLVLLGLEGEVFGSSALLARNHVDDLFLGLGRRRVRAETACGTFDCLDCGDSCDYLVKGSCLRRWRQENPCQMSRNLLAGACTRSCTISRRIFSQGSLTEPGLHQRRRELAPCELLPRYYRHSMQVEELVLEVLPRSRLHCLASDGRISFLEKSPTDELCLCR